VRSTDLQSRRLVEDAKRGALAPGWQHTGPELLQAQGRSGKGAMPAMVAGIRMNPELEERLHRPGGWLTLPVISAPGTDLEAALSWLRNTLWGGGARLAEQVAETLRGAGFTGVQVFPAAQGSTLRAVVAQRPA